MVFVCRRISEHESAKKKFEKCGARCFTFSRRAPLGQLVTAECRTFTTIVGRLRAVGGSNNSGSRLSRDFQNYSNQKNAIFWFE